MAEPMAGLPLIKPMLAVPGPLPSPQADPGFGYELKWDGLRAVAYIPGDGSLRLLSRSERDITAHYPELAPLGEQLAATPCVLDGEIIALGPDGRPSFGVLQHRMNPGRPARIDRLAQRLPVDFMLFDVMHLNGQPATALGYRERRALLEDLRAEGPRWRTPPFWVGHGEQALELTREHRLEGVMAKRLASSYAPGVRSRNWIKVKNVLTQEVVIGGWTEGTGRRAGALGALLVGLPGESGLRYAGSVGSGFSERGLELLRPVLDELATDRSPFDGPVPVRHAHWVQPRLVGEVAYGDWTEQGRLRHPRWRGLRPDKSPGEVA